MANFTIDDLNRPSVDRRILAPKPIRNLMYRLADQRLMDEIAINCIEESFSEHGPLIDSEKKTIIRFKKLVRSSWNWRIQDFFCIFFRNM